MVTLQSVVSFDFDKLKRNKKVLIMQLFLDLVSDMVVMDVLQTKIEDSARENMELRAELDILKKEMEGEAVMFNMKVAEFQNQFYRVEEEIRLKNAEIERLRANDCSR